uniref:Uncharacterized protein n=1 Tax=Oryza barthii TaxID=65489 RepID=A0A0D3HMR3_9ORYZ
MARGSKPGHSIYRVPQYIKNMTNPKAYRPQVVSLGPFHHGDSALVPMEKHKCRAVANLVKQSGKPLQEFIAAVEEIKVQLQDACIRKSRRHMVPRYTLRGDVAQGYGCFLLEMGRVIQQMGESRTMNPMTLSSATTAAYTCCPLSDPTWC